MAEVLGVVTKHSQYLFQLLLHYDAVSSCVPRASFLTCVCGFAETPKRGAGPAQICRSSPDALIDVPWPGDSLLCSAGVVELPYATISTTLVAGRVAAISTKNAGWLS